MKKSYLFGLILIILLVLSGCVLKQEEKQKDDNTLIKNVCGNNVCENSERYSSCSQDCKRPELKDLALKLEDLPQGYLIEGRGIRTREDIDQIALYAGWKEGYMVIFRESTNPDIKIKNYLSIYPKDKIKFILDNFSPSQYLGNYLELEKPDIGDDSRAFKEKVDYTSNDVTKPIFYLIIFNKADILVQVIGQDYEQVNELAKKLSERI